MHRKFVPSFVVVRRPPIAITSKSLAILDRSTRSAIREKIAALLCQEISAEGGKTMFAVGARQHTVLFMNSQGPLDQLHVVGP